MAHRGRLFFFSFGKANTTCQKLGMGEHENAIESIHTGKVFLLSIDGVFLVFVAVILD